MTSLRRFKQVAALSCNRSDHKIIVREGNTIEEIAAEVEEKSDFTAEEFFGESK